MTSKTNNKQTMKRKLKQTATINKQNNNKNNEQKTTQTNKQNKQH